MLDFKKPALEDNSWIKPILNTSFGLGAENAFGTILIWSDSYNLEVCHYKNFLLRRYSEAGKQFFLFPVGSGDLKDCLNTLFDYSIGKNNDIIFTGLTQKYMEQLEELFPDKFEYLEERDKEDYIYNSFDLMNLKGKKYHSKRNHISKFNRLYNWTFEEICADNIDECKSFCDKWFLENMDAKRQDIIYEKYAINKAFEFYKELFFVGGIIRVDGNIVALTFGEKINKHIFDIHFEKALKEYTGAYSLINNEFAKRYLSEFSYINREEDLGIAGLRQVKLSYHPVALLKRYKAFLR